VVIKEGLRTLIGFSFRLIPFPTETGLKVFGHPDENSPVFVTGNFDLTVKRVAKYLQNLDCYLLVAPSKGINVWCAACGDSFNAGSVISVIRTSGISARVRHRKLILPQLAAPGVDLKRVAKETGWHCEFGPVYARNIPAYLNNGFKKTETMRRAAFGLKDRLDVGFGCTFIGYLLAGILLLVLQIISGISWFFKFNLIFWPLLFLMYILYPYTPGKTGRQKVFSWLILFAVGLTTYLLVSWKNVSADIIGLFVGSIIGALFIGLDFGGVAPITKSDLDPLIARLGFSNWGDALQFENTRIRLILGMERINLDGSECIGCGVCGDICPVGVYRMDHKQKKSVINCPSKCIVCTACIVQCPSGAISGVQNDEKKKSKLINLAQNQV
jgi:ferredoxin